MASDDGDDDSFKVWNIFDSDPDESETPPRPAMSVEERKAYPHLVVRYEMWEHALNQSYLSVDGQCIAYPGPGSDIRQAFLDRTTAPYFDDDGAIYMYYIGDFIDEQAC